MQIADLLKETVEVLRDGNKDNLKHVSYVQTLKIIKSVNMEIN